MSAASPRAFDELTCDVCRAIAAGLTRREPPDAREVTILHRDRDLFWVGFAVGVFEPGCAEPAVPPSGLCEDCARSYARMVP